MFVGGLNWDTTEDNLRRYFGQFGPVSSCTVMRDGASGRSRGFAFVTFVDPKSVNAVMVREHYLDGKIIDPKRAIPRPEQSKTQKCFVGGLPQSVTQDSFRRLFQQYGHVLDSTVMMDKDTGRPRGFGFVTFENDEGVEKTLAAQPLTLDGKQIEVKRAQSRGQPSGSSAQPNRFTPAADSSRSGPAPLRMWGAPQSGGESGAAPAAGACQDVPADGLGQLCVEPADGVAADDERVHGQRRCRQGRQRGRGLGCQCRPEPSCRLHARVRRWRHRRRLPACRQPPWSAAGWPPGKRLSVPARALAGAGIAQLRRAVSVLGFKGTM